MKHLLWGMILLFSFTQVVFSQDIDEIEIKSYGNRTIEFINYEGPRTGKIDSFEEIVNIGRSMGSRIDILRLDDVTYSAKYTILHIFEPGNSDKLDADILILHKGSRVDHIRNLRYIIAGYLESAYNYNFKDALILAEFITYYNAVYYQNMTYFSDKYKPAVLSSISAENAGISTHYSNWPGKTRLLIPLRKPASKGDLSTVDTGSLTDDDVIELIREEEDKGIDTRKDMTDLEERIIDEDQKELDEKKEELVKKEEQIDEELETLEDKEETQGLTPEEKEKKEELVTQKEEIEEEKAVLEEEQAKIDEQTEEVIKQRDGIAEDENQIFENETTDQVQTAVQRTVEVLPAYFHRIDSIGGVAPYGTILKVDLNEKAKMLIESPVTSIRGDTVLIGSAGVVAIAGSEKNGSVKLVELDSEKLEIVKESVEEIFPGAALIEHNSRYYTVIDSKGKYYIGSFDNGMKLKARSQLQVKGETSIIFQDKWVLVQDGKDKILILDASTLEEKP